MYLDDAEQQAWHAQLERLRLHMHSGDTALLGRLRRRRLRPSDEERLKQLRRQAIAAALPRNLRLILRQFPDAAALVRPEVRDDFQVALRENSFPPFLLEEIRRVSSTFASEPSAAGAELPERTRHALLQAWPYLQVLLGNEAAALRQALDEETYEPRQVTTLLLAAERHVPDVLEAADRKLLVRQAMAWRPLCRPGEHDRFVKQLKSRHVSAHLLADVGAFLDAARARLQAAQDGLHSGGCPVRREPRVNGDEVQLHVHVDEDGRFEVDAVYRGKQVGLAISGADPDWPVTVQ